MINSVDDQLLNQEARRLKSVYYSTHDALKAIIQLHGCIRNNGADAVTWPTFQVDFTYGNGGFYKQGIPEPPFKYDLNPKVVGVHQLDFCHIPFPDDSLGFIVWDPPYITGAGAESIMGEHFGSYRNMKDLRQSYAVAIAEFARVLYTGGRIVIKCQDGVSGGEIWWNTDYIRQCAEWCGLKAIGRVLTVNSSKMRGHNHRADNQQHFDTCHCFFWIMERI